MDTNHDELITGLKTKIKRLISLYEEEKSENKILLETNNELNAQIESNRIKFEELEKEYNTVKVAKFVEASSEDKQDAKTKINSLVREIDNCIALLNK